MRACIETVLPTPPEVVWETLKRSSTLVYVTRGMMSFERAEHFPARWSEGQMVDTRIRLFGVIPGWRHCLQIARVDDEQHVIQTFERGGLIDKWHHRIEVLADAAGTRYVDELDIEAGGLTAAVGAFAKAFCRYRQRRLKNLLAQMRF